MKKSVLIILLIGGAIYSCGNLSNSDSRTTLSEEKSSMPSLLDTKWQLKIADECINYYIFKADSNSIYYSCESDDKYYSKYYIKEDTLYIHNFITNTDSLLSSMESEHRSQQAKYKLVLEDNRLKHVERWSYSIPKDLWVRDNFNFGNDFLFEQVK
tara:strand:+ start:6647 stop:7114 length:468 start_codon:yes stop_codon:yes gene_type:complete